MALDDQHALLLDIGARLTSLEKGFDRAAGIVKKKSREMEASATGLEKFFGRPSLGKALDKTFDATRFKVLDSGAAKVGLFGSALESLGPAGLAAAAGVGAFALVVSQAAAAADFADSLDDTAKRLHITTTALQEYRYAIRVAGGEEKGADEALESFSQTLGKAKEGLGRALKGFKELGFSPAQVKGFRDTDTALKAVAERISKITDTSLQDAIIQQLGLDGLKPLLLSDAGAMARLREEAHKVGVVMSEDLVRKGADAHDKMETLSKVIDVQLKSAFVDAAPAIVHLTQLVADLVSWLGKVEKFATGGFAQEIAADAARTQRNADLRSMTRNFAELNDPKHPPSATRAADLRRMIAEEAARIGKAGDVINPPGTGGTTYTPPAGGGVHAVGGTAKGPTAAEIAELQRKRDIENELAVAEAANDKARIAEAQRRVEYERLLEDAEKAHIADARGAAINQQMRLESARQLAQAAEDERKATEKTLEATKSLVQKKAQLAEEADRKAAAEKDAQAEFDRAAAEKVRDANKAIAGVADANYQAFKDSTYDGIRSGLEAIKDHHLMDFIVSSLENGLFSRIAQLGSTWIAGHQGGTGFGGLLAGAAGFLFPSQAPHNAGGNDRFGGGWTHLNERGGEGVAFLPPGTQIIPNDVLRSLARMHQAGGVDRRALAITYAPQIHVAGGAQSLAGIDAMLDGHGRRLTGQILARVPGFLAQHEKYQAA